jgi:hypothetical protein
MWRKIMNGKIINTKSRPKWMMPMVIAAIVFGFATVISGGKSLFTEVGSVAAGNYVPFVLWFNFVAGFAYVLAGVGMAQDRAWSRKLAVFIAAATCLVFVFFGIHIAMGGAYENRTVMAMVLRSGFWLIVAKQMRLKK